MGENPSDETSGNASRRENRWYRGVRLNGIVRSIGFVDLWWETLAALAAAADLQSADIRFFLIADF